jgi:P4 family phage/plasmid primase-like protien
MTSVLTPLVEVDNTVMSTNSKRKNNNITLHSFLLKHTVPKGNPDKVPITNTRIGKFGITPGSYNISGEDNYNTFLKLYERDILKKNKNEYLTEYQLKDDGPLIVDIDLRYDIEVDYRKHNEYHINELIENYLCILNDAYKMDNNTEFKIYIMEKPNVNRVTEKSITKDGIHLLFTLKVERIMQIYIRKKIIESMQDQWKDIPKINDWDDIFDHRIANGGLWQLYGSSKPKHDTYKVTNVYNVTFDESEGECKYSKINFKESEIDILELSVRNNKHLELEYSEEQLHLIKLFREEEERVKNSKRNNSNNSLCSMNQNNDMDHVPLNIEEINSKSDIDKLYDQFLDNLRYDDYYLKEVAQFTMALPEKFYGMGTYDDWIRVCWALRNTSNRLLIVWLKFSSQSRTFNCTFDELDELFTTWKNAGERCGSVVTSRSIIHWVRHEAKEKYEEIHSKTIGYYIDRTIYGADGVNSLKSDKYEGGEVELAQVLYQIFKNDYVCTSIKGNIWYKYENHRWKPNDSGTSLRRSISEKMRSLYNSKSVEVSKSLSQRIDSDNIEEGEKQKLVEKQKLTGRKIIEIIKFLNKSNDKKNIMIEAKELFYDSDFIEKLDQNPYLLCFNNGVMDFKENRFRDGRPDDYISLSTKINYVKLSEKSLPIQNDIKKFFSQLFPNEELRKYMWQHLASTLLGTTDSQTFNMYIGQGQNGKSVLVTLMEQILGEYKGDVPLSMITEKRGKVGGVSPEIVQLRGIRLALMQEPKKGDTINEGIMKQLTSGEDNLQGRAPYMEKTISFKPQLKLIVTANVFMVINSNDHGTWRRIRVCPFESLFTENPKTDDPDKPHQFPLDPRLSKEKFPAWKEVFMSMLIDITKETKGSVKDCNKVLEHSKLYRASQDYISAFVQEKVVKHANSYIEKNEINQEFKMWWASNYGQGRREPPAKEVHEYIDRNFGKCKDGMWKNVKIKYTTKLSNIDDDDIPDANANDL